MYAGQPNIEEMKAAAKNGDPQAAFDLGWCYYIGNGVGQDTTEAWSWYREAAQRGIREADEIVHILEAEADRVSELKSLSQREKQPTVRERRVTWLVVAVLVPVSIGLVGILLHVLNRKSAVSQEGSGLGREEPAAKGPETTSIDEGTHDVAIVREEASIQDEQSELKTQTSPPNTLSGERDKAFDFNDVVPFAEKWLEPTDGTYKFK